MNTACKEFEDALYQLVEKVGPANALPLVTGAFVGLVVGYAAHTGHDTNVDITINSCGQRDITIHKPKSVEAEVPA